MSFSWGFGELDTAVFNGYKGRNTYPEARRKICCQIW